MNLVGKPCPSTYQRGFTLMELLVAMTLLGILMATLFGGLRLGTRVWEASDRTVESSSKHEIVRGFLRTRLEEMLPMAAADRTERQEFLFQGNQQDVRFVAPMPISVGSQPFLIELSLEHRGGADQVSDLMLRWRPLEAFAHGERAEPGERVLIEDVAEIALGYFGSREKRTAGTWWEDWQDQETLPELIRVDLRFHGSDQREWLPLTVSPMIDQWYDTVY